MQNQSFLALLLAASLPAAAFGQTQEPAKAKAEPARAKPQFADVPYGPHPQNRLDFWRAEGDGPRPLLVYIHGGGWRGGLKTLQPTQVDPYLAKGISVASITYRFTPENPLPAPVHDAARAIQFIRSKANEWNLDKKKIALTGGRAGACTSMWLLFHDDIADPKSDDPVLRESTRVIAAAVAGGQTSIDPKVIEPWLGSNVLLHPMIPNAVGEPTSEAALKNYEKHAALYHEFSAINHVSADDGALLMTYSPDMSLPSKNSGHGIHHPVYGVKMKEACDKAGVECHLIVPGSFSSEKFENAAAFLMAKLLQ